MMQMAHAICQPHTQNEQFCQTTLVCKKQKCLKLMNKKCKKKKKGFSFLPYLLIHFKFLLNDKTVYCNHYIPLSNCYYSTKTQWWILESLQISVNNWFYSANLSKQIHKMIVILNYKEVQRSAFTNKKESIPWLEDVGHGRKRYCPILFVIWLIYAF